MFAENCITASPITAELLWKWITLFQELEKEPYFHGSLPLEDVQGLLQNKGDFLVRTMEPEQDKPCGVRSLLADFMGL